MNEPKNVEVFHCPRDYEPLGEDGKVMEEGWYYWFVLPGCLPDSDPVGPFETSEAAEVDARSLEED